MDGGSGGAGPGQPGGRHATTASCAGGTLLLISRVLAGPQTSVRVLRTGRDGRLAEVAAIGSLAETPNLPVPKPQLDLVSRAEPDQDRDRAAVLARAGFGQAAGAV